MLGLLDAFAAPCSDPMPLGMRALLSTRPQRRYKQVFMLDATVASRATAASHAALVDDQTTFGALLLDVAPCLSLLNTAIAHAAAATTASHLLCTVIGAAFGIEAPRHLLSTATTTCFDSCTTTTVLVILDTTTVSQFDTYHFTLIALATPYIAATKTRMHHLFNSTAWLHLPRMIVSRNLFNNATWLHRLFLTRATSTTTISLDKDEVIDD